MTARDGGYFRQPSRLLCVALLLWTQATDAARPVRHLEGSATPSAEAAIADVHLDGTLELPASSREHNITLGMGCPEFLSAFHEANMSSTVPYRSFSIIKGAGYAYVALHFEQLWIPVGASMVLRAVENVDVPDHTLNLTNTTFSSGVMYANVSAPPILAKELRVELYRDVGPAEVESKIRTDGSSADKSATNDHHCYGFAVNMFNYVLLDAARNITPSYEAICGQDNSKEAICYYDDSATRDAYLAARAVARLLIQKEDGKSSACTGWLLGPQGHLITNYHCVNTTAQAAATTVEFMADAQSCSQNCMSWGACPGTVEAISTTLVWANADLDYALLKLPTNAKLTAKYGFLRLKATQGYVNQEIYIPQHPLYYGKRIVMVNDYGTKTTILSTNATGCGTTGYSYNGDTQPGSSGSPVIDAQDHGVVALHHCGDFCSNTGIPSISIIADMKANGVLPPGAVDPGDKGNLADFPSWQPVEAVVPPPLVPNMTFSGTIQRAPHARQVSVDRFYFNLPFDTEVSFDVLSAEVSDDGKYSDLNGDCQANYLDAIIFLFNADDGSTVLVNDDDKTGNGKADGSISRRDPYAQTFLKTGNYVLAVTAMPATAKDAYKGFITLGPDDPEIYTCVTHSMVGSYRVLFSTSGTILIDKDRLPPVVPVTGTCTVPASSICAF